MNLFKIFSKQKLLILIVLILIFFIGFVLFYILKKQNDLRTPVLKDSVFSINHKENLDLPARLKIPQINIDAPVEFVGLNLQGEVGAPLGPTEVAWFELGPIPGEQGSAIISGHSGWKNGAPAVFDNLYKLKKGDKIYVENNNGTKNTFIVKEIKKYNLNDDITEVFISKDQEAYLNLITCIGFWNKISKSHSSRLVVFTQKLIE